MLDSARNAPQSPCGFALPGDFSFRSPMKQVFLIGAHKDAAQLDALVAALDDPDFVVYVHLDCKSAIDPGALHPAARLVRERIDVRWGRFSQVEAILVSARQILAEVPDFDKLVFLSAQDYPLLPNALLKRELDALRGRELIETAPIGPGGWNVAHRYQYFHREGGGRLERLACGLLNRGMKLLKRGRRFPAGLMPHGGSCWWALSRDCVQEILRLHEAHPELARLCRSAQCPDELFFQTLVMNSRFAERVLAQNFRYIQWPEGGARNPKLLDEGDLARIQASGAHFCRKLDSQASAGLLLRLAEWKESRAAA